MYVITLETILLFLIISIIGLGPISFILNRQKNLVFYFALAPAFGLTILTLLGTYLVLLNIPIVKWAMPLTIICVPVSLLLCFFRWNYFKKNITGINAKNSLLFASGLMLVMFLLFVPMIIGKLNFFILRGNGTDQFNYMTMAQYLLYEPYSWIKVATVQQLINQNSSYALAQQLLLDTRWSTSMLMGYASAIMHVPLTQCVYGVCLIFLMATYCIAYALINFLAINRWVTLLAAIAITIGFYGQFILDLQAMSQLSALPIILLLASFIVILDQEEQGLFIIERIYLGLALSAIIFLYVETVPTVLLGIGIYVIVELFKRSYSIKKISYHCLSIVIVILAIMPMAVFLYHILFDEIYYAVAIKNTWWQAYFVWLYKNPLSGFWGMLNFINPTGHSFIWKLIDFCWRSFGLFVGGILTFIFVISIVDTVIRKLPKIQTVLKLSVAMALGALIQFMILYMNEQYWAAGKVLTYAFPFYFIIILASITVTNLNFLKKIKPIGLSIVMIWLVAQCGFGFVRLYYVHKKTNYTNYIANDGEYRLHHWAIPNIKTYLKDHHIKQVAILTKNSGTAEYLSFALTPSIRSININDINSGYNALVRLQEGSAFSEYAIITNDMLGFNDVTKLAVDKSFSLIKYDQNES